MRRAVLAALLVGGCYQPSPPYGAPCDLRHPCPSTQSCIAGTCGGHDDTMADARVTSMVDAMVDGMITATDLDGDGVPNTMDNCPNYSNPNQANEDGDPLGDPCDPCPIDPASPPSDPDNDGVSDSCDPRPTTAGDTILVFEGFKGGVVPSNWQVQGTASPAGDGVNLNSSAYAGIVPPVTIAASGMVMIKATILQTIGQNDSTLAVVMHHEPNQDKGMYCELYAPNAGSTNGREIDLWDSGAQVERGKTAYAWQTNVAYVLSQRATGNNFTCSATPMGGTATSTSGSGATPGANTGAFIYGANVNIAWMLVVASN
jgi:hypothetical protein